MKNALGSFCKTTVAFLIFLRRQLINKHHDNNTHLRTRAKKETSKGPNYLQF